nr:hypothetical protein [Microbacterium lemovicicum]
MTGDIPSRMFFAGRRWTVTDVPTRLRESVWASGAAPRRGLYGWRFQATDVEGASFVFDVFRAQDSWHVHRSYC